MSRFVPLHQEFCGAAGFVHRTGRYEPDWRNGRDPPGGRRDSYESQRIFEGDCCNGGGSRRNGQRSAGFLYIRHNASSTKNIGKTDIMIAVGFSAGSLNIMQVIARQYGTQTTPDKIYPNYVCDAVDHESADLSIAIPIYGMGMTGFGDDLDMTVNPNLPAMFGVIGQKDFLRDMTLENLPAMAKLYPDLSFYLAPDAPHGFGLGTGTKGYVNAFTQAAQWPDMAINFIESRLGLQEKTIDMDSVAFAW